MKTKNTTIFVLILAIVASLVFVAFNGLKIGKFEIRKAKDSINLGLELAGGVYVVLEADTDAKGEELQQIMEQTKSIISERIDGLGVTQPNIAIENGNRIRIELAGVQDPQEAINLIGKTAQLQFVDPKGNVILTGKNVKKSQVRQQDREMGKREVVVTLEFDEQGKKAFADATGALIHEQQVEDRIIYIILDDKIISNPAVANIAEGGQAITDGQAVIQGGFTVESATQLSNLINAGSLPVDMIERTTSVIGPTLGLEAFEKSILAGGISLLFIFVLMMAVYKIPGFIASIGLIIYTLLVVGTMSALGVVLTLPGIAGLILSIGMAVDANVLIFERIREELRDGKTVRAAIDAGFKRALTSVADSNITTLIAGAVLYYFGSGPIKGFGVTLMLGIVASVLTAVVITKYLLKLASSIFGDSNIKIYGA